MKYYLNNINKINIEYYNIQLNIIKKTLGIINNLENIDETNIDKYNKNLKIHINLCFKWCKSIMYLSIIIVNIFNY